VKSLWVAVAIFYQGETTGKNAREGDPEKQVAAASPPQATRALAKHWYSGSGT